nr:hypothetical protein CFP56_62739 [Quercus suber]
MISTLVRCVPDQISYRTAVDFVRVTVLQRFNDELLRRLPLLVILSIPTPREQIDPPCRSLPAFAKDHADAPLFTVVGTCQTIDLFMHEALNY